tara:strand:+ start:172 stop:1122 length:951 start_codon:yes stop_codon:yes gene_type:complete
MNYSVVIPSYRSEAFIGRAIESCLAEGIAGSNIFVVEDGVYDNTALVVKKYPEVNLIQLEENSGAPSARNLGLTRVHTDYIMFLDADDYIENSLATGLINAAISTDADVVFGPWRYGGDHRNDGVIRRPEVKTTQRWLISWLNFQIVPTCSVLWKTSTIKRIGAWDERLKKNQDGELMVRAFLEKVKIAYTNDGCGVYWQHNSPNRVSSASYKSRIFTSDVIYKNILDTANEEPNVFGSEDFLFEVGRFCCKTAWFAAEGSDKKEYCRWTVRARNLGFKKFGYNRKSDLMARLIGLKYAAKLKNKIRPFFIFAIQR